MKKLFLMISLLSPFYLNAGSSLETSNELTHSKAALRVRFKPSDIARDEKRKALSQRQQAAAKEGEKFLMSKAGEWIYGDYLYNNDATAFYFLRTYHPATNVEEQFHSYSPHIGCKPESTTRMTHAYKLYWKHATNGPTIEELITTAIQVKKKLAPTQQKLLGRHLKKALKRRNHERTHPEKRIEGELARDYGRILAFTQVTLPNFDITHIWDNPFLFDTLTNPHSSFALPQET